MRLRISALLLLPLGFALLAGCNEEKVVRIGDLQADPDKYDGSKVQIVGKVTDGKSVLGFGAYQLDDGSGRIWVLTDRGTPDEGRIVWVEGEFQAESTIGSNKVMAIEEEKREIR